MRGRGHIGIGRLPRAGAWSARRLRRVTAGLAALVLVVVLSACGGSGKKEAAATTETVSATTTAVASGEAVPTPAQEKFLVEMNNVTYAYCQKPTKPVPVAVTAAVNRMIAIYRANPSAVSKGSSKPGKTFREILADLGGLLNSDCDAALGEKVGKALAE